MEANEAPEKLYMNWVNYPLEEMQVEYTRIDAFIRKAIEYIITHIPDMHTLGIAAKMDECIIEDFRKYMEE